MTVPYAVTRAAQSLWFTFLWKNKKDKIKRKVVFQPLENSHLNFINFEMRVKSLRLAWIVRLIGNSDDNWKAIPNFYFNKYGGLPFLLKCNCNTTVLTKFRCKNYCSLFIEKFVSEPSAVRAWKKSFSELPDWGDCFVNIYKFSTFHF